MLKILLLGMGGFLGAVSRYLLSGFVQHHTTESFPTGTLAVNFLGCFLIGSLMFLIEDRQLFTPNARVFLTVGFLGALTTFSTFAYETLELLRDSQWFYAVCNAGSNLIFCLLGVWLGTFFTRMIYCN